MTEANGTITLDVTVTNTGSVAGKDAVQVYFNPPYTDGGIEKASANLVTFGKTDSIEPGASQTLTLTFNTKDMASFDSKDKGCYVLEEGDYIISINEDSHTVLDSKTYNVASTIVYDESNPRSTDAEAATTKFDFADDKLVTLSRADHFANYVPQRRPTPDDRQDHRSHAGYGRGYVDAGPADPFQAETYDGF